MGRITVFLLSLNLLLVFALLANMMWASGLVAQLPVISRVKATAAAAASCVSPSVDISWYPSPKSDINSLDSLEDSHGVYGFVFNGSTNPAGTMYGTYNWCNMPHVRSQEYQKTSIDYKLEYVEVVSTSVRVEDARLTYLPRSIATTNAHHTLPTLFHMSPILGTVTKKHFSTMAQPTSMGNLQRSTVSTGVLNSLVSA